MKKLSLLSIFTLLAACGSDDDKGTPSCEIDQIDIAVQTVAPDYSSSAVALACSEEAGIIDNLLEKSDSDYTISAGSDRFYHIGKSGIDTIAQYNYDTYSLQNWQYSTNADNEEGSSNPYKILEVSNNKAFIIRYNKPQVWVVNPSATSAEDFYVNSLDLTNYLGTYEVTNESEETTTVNETTVNVADAIIVNNKLFIAMQRIGANYNYANDSKVAIFNVETLTEINTENTTGENAITLNGHNVQALSSTDNYVYVASRGNYGNDYGQLEKISLNDYTLSTVLEGSADLGHISNVQSISDTQLYVLGNYSGYNSESEYVYQYNLLQVNAQTKEIKENISAFKGDNIADIALADDNNLWIASGNKSKPGIYEIDTTNNRQLTFIPTNLNPSSIIFK
ncbi:hypothetical protein QNI23_004080 [Bermanella sp. WJH001]|uniref:hypothetical protein n=1 Tax=Bermanella sp. WJH001 TaxID=3048005 RepID=UPI0024BD6259|nr:hypothetical protein [Bermanella sp. WJH001]MDJ1539661.1 hypothetical protein [Bermanella sp. WJH001]